MCAKREAAHIAIFAMMSFPKSLRIFGIMQKASNAAVA
jgi:hypothetical protein